VERADFYQRRIIEGEIIEKEKRLVGATGIEPVTTCL
jgi:hypothetical protein